MTYEDRLLGELRHIVATTPAPARRRRSLRMPVAAGATATAAVAAAALLVATGGDPAYAVQASGGDGVTVTINDIRDAAGLQDALRDAGIRADVRYVADAPRCTEPPQPGAKGDGPQVVSQARAADGDGPSFVHSKPGAPPGAGAPAPAGGQVAMMVRRDGSATFTVDPDTFDGGQRLTITAAGGDLRTLAIAIGGPDAPPPLCLP